MSHSAAVAAVAASRPLSDTNHRTTTDATAMRQAIPFSLWYLPATAAKRHKETSKGRSTGTGERTERANPAVHQSHHRTTILCNSVDTTSRPSPPPRMSTQTRKQRHAYMCTKEMTCSRRHQRSGRQGVGPCCSLMGAHVVFGPQAVLSMLSNHHPKSHTQGRTEGNTVKAAKGWSSRAGISGDNRPGPHSSIRLSRVQTGEGAN